MPVLKMWPTAQLLDMEEESDSHLVASELLRPNEILNVMSIFDVPLAIIMIAFDPEEGAQNTEEELVAKIANKRVMLDKCAT
jgi:hypothetical protein